MISVESMLTVQTSYRCWRVLASRCGWDVPDEKSPPPAFWFRLLGVLVNLWGMPKTPPLIQMVEDRFWKIVGTLLYFKETRSLGSGPSGKFVGQLGFACSQFYGRWGRAMLRPFYRRQHEEHRFRLNKQLNGAIHWWLKNLWCAPPRPVFALSFPRHLVVSYSDGEGGDAGVGIAAWCEERLGPTPIAGFMEVPETIRHLWSKQKASHILHGEFNDIAEIEAIGPLLILHNWPWLLRNALWIHFIDNNGALGALVNGSSSVDSQEIITGATWQLVAQLETMPWFDRVDSSSNPVDGLSRKDFSGNWSWREISFPAIVLRSLTSSLS